jgi:hypothetical protein
MIATLYVSLPHPHDAILNFALSLLKEGAQPGQDRFFCHGDVDRALQRHSRNLLHGIDSRRDKVLDVMKWLRSIADQSSYIHVYNRFFLADYEMPATLSRVSSFLELVALYFGRYQPRLVLVDYGRSFGGAKAHCAEQIRQKVLRNGGIESEAARAAGAYREKWCFSPEALLDRFCSRFGSEAARIVKFENSHNMQDFVRDLRDVAFAGRDGAAAGLLGAPGGEAAMIAALERRAARMS